MLSLSWIFVLNNYISENFIVHLLNYDVLLLLISFISKEVPFWTII